MLRLAGMTMSIGFLVCCGSPTTDDKEITAVIDRFYLAAENQDWPTLRATLTDDWLLFTPSARTETVDELINDWQNHTSGVRVIVKNVRVNFAPKGTMAWATYEQWAEYDWKGKSADQKGMLTSIFVKTDDGWKIAHTHRSSTRPVVY